ncbi:hypothetical protein BH10PSE19_BH10PSE19_22540 [soil metagenome]
MFNMRAEATIAGHYKPLLSNTESSVEEKRRIFARLWDELRRHSPTFYIDSPGAELAAELYKIAAEITKDNNSAGDVWKTLMPTLHNTTQITLDELPGYDGRNSLILTDDNHLVTIQELEATISPSRVALLNPYKTAKFGSLTRTETDQLQLKDNQLWQRYYNTAPWMSQLTYEKIVFVLNIAVSSTSHPDGIKEVVDDGVRAGIRETFLMRFENGLTNYDFRQSFQHYLNNYGDNIAADYEFAGADYSAEQNLKLSFCFAYLINYLDSLPKAEQEAFNLINLNGLSFKSLITSFHAGGCASIVSQDMARIVVALTSPENKGKLKNQLRREYDLTGVCGSQCVQVLPTTSPKRFTNWLKSFAWKRIAFVTLLSLGTYPLYCALEWLMTKAMDFSLGITRKITTQPYLWLLLGFGYFKDINRDLYDYDNKAKKRTIYILLAFIALFTFATWCVYTAVRLAETIAVAILSPYHTYCKVRFHAFMLVKHICKIFNCEDLGPRICPWVGYLCLAIMVTGYLALIVFAAPAAAGLLGALLGGVTKSVFLADILAKISTIPYVGQIFQVVGNFLANNIITPILNYFSVSAVPDLVAGMATLVSIITTCQLAQLIYKAVAMLRCASGLALPPKSQISERPDESKQEGLSRQPKGSSGSHAQVSSLLPELTPKQEENDDTSEVPSSSSSTPAPPSRYAFRAVGSFQRSSGVPPMLEPIDDWAEGQGLATGAGVSSTPRYDQFPH